jgi:hypothetical protein
LPVGELVDSVADALGHGTGRDDDVTVLAVRRTAIGAAADRPDALARAE